MLRVDHVGEYKDQFLWFSQNTGISIHFIIRKHGVVKEMNTSLLAKVRYLFSNAQLDKFFWPEALEYASYLMNRLSSNTIRDKTLLDIGRVELLRTMICCGYLDVRPTLVSKMTNWNSEQISLCFWMSRGIWNAKSYRTPKTRRLCRASISRLMRIHCWSLPSLTRWRGWRPRMYRSR